MFLIINSPFRHLLETYYKSAAQYEETEYAHYDRRIHFKKAVDLLIEEQVEDAEEDEGRTHSNDYGLSFTYPAIETFHYYRENQTKKQHRRTGYH